MRLNSGAENMGSKKEEKIIQNGLAGIWESIRHGYPASSLFYEYWADLFCKTVGQRVHGWILDCGSGTGFLLRQLSKRTNANLVGLDVSSAMLRSAKLNSVTDKLSYVQADMEHLPFKSASLNVVTCMGSLHHMSNIDKAVGEIRRVLKDEGRLIFSETHRSWILEPFRMILKKSGKFSLTHKSLSEQTIDAILKKNSFNIVYKRYFGYIAFALLGFPDILPTSQKVPVWLANSLIELDELLARVPLVQRVSWHLFFHVNVSKNV